MWTEALILTLLCIAGIFAKNGDIDWTHLDVTYSVIGGHYEIPITLAKFLRKDKKYTLMTTDTDLNVDFYSYSNDPRVSVGYDSYGNIAAIRMGIPKADIEKRALKKRLSFNFTSYYDSKPLYTSGNFWNTNVYYSTVLFASPETLKAGGRSMTNGLVAENIYLPINGTYTLMPKYECDAPNLGFTKGGCFTGMGIHYIQGMSQSLACEDHEGPFLIYVGGDLVSLGWFPFGTFTNTRQRTWFEDPPASLTKVFAPDAPDCFQDWASNYGVVSFHIFLKKHSQLTSCLLGGMMSAC